MSRSFRNFALVAQQTGLVDLNGPLVSRRVMAVVQPVIDQFQVVTNTTAIHSNPVNALDQQPLHPIAPQGCTAKLQRLGSFLFADKLNHGSSFLVYTVEAKSHGEADQVCPPRPARCDAIAVESRHGRLPRCQYSVLLRCWLKSSPACVELL